MNFWHAMWKLRRLLPTGAELARLEAMKREREQAESCAKRFNEIQQEINAVFAKRGEE